MCEAIQKWLCRSSIHCVEWKVTAVVTGKGICMEHQSRADTKVTASVTSVTSLVATFLSRKRSQKILQKRDYFQSHWGVRKDTLFIRERTKVNTDFTDRLSTMCFRTKTCPFCGTKAVVYGWQKLSFSCKKSLSFPTSCMRGKWLFFYRKILYFTPHVDI